MLLKRVTEQIMRTKGFVDLESNIILYFVMAPIPETVLKNPFPLIFTMLKLPR